MTSENVSSSRISAVLGNLSFYGFKITRCFVMGHLCLARLSCRCSGESPLTDSGAFLILIIPSAGNTLSMALCAPSYTITSSYMFNKLPVPNTVSAFLANLF